MPEVKSGKKSQEGQTVEPQREPHIIPPESFLGLGEVLSRLVNEAVRARVSHRALLRILMQEDAFSWQDYIENYDAIMREDGAGLAASILLKPEVLEQMFGEWRKADLQKYGYKRKMLRSKGEKTADKA